MGGFFDFSDRLDMEKDVSSVYLQLTNTRGNFDYTVGMRGEYMYRELMHRNAYGNSALRRMDYFPSLMAVWNRKENEMIRFAYSKRINRPTTKAFGTIQK